jgi:hypothetical protein
LTFPLLDCSEFGNFVITLISYQDFIDICIAANKEARESKVASGDVEIIAWKVLQSPS